MAFFVGTFINAYGHLLVPGLRGRDHPLDDFLVELYAAPALVVVSLGLAYAFPLIVSAYSAVSALAEEHQPADNRRDEGGKRDA